MNPQSQLACELIETYLGTLHQHKIRPHLLVNPKLDRDICLPEPHSSKENVVLNISPSAIVNFQLDSQGMAFETCFEQKSYSVYLPLRTITAIFAHESRHGLVFLPAPL